jgi:hypothetical protein
VLVGAGGPGRGDVHVPAVVDLADDPSAVLLAPAASVAADAVSAVVGFALAAGIRFDIRPGLAPGLATPLRRGPRVPTGAGGGAGGPGAGNDHPRPRHRPMAERQRQTVVWNGLTDGQRERLTALGVQPQAAPITPEQPGPAKSAAGRSTAFTRGLAACGSSPRRTRTPLVALPQNAAVRPSAAALLPHHSPQAGPRCSFSVKATLTRAPRRRIDQIPSSGKGSDPALPGPADPGYVSPG